MRAARVHISYLALILYVAFAALTCPAWAAPDGDVLGKVQGYPIGTRANWFYDERVRV